MKHEIHRMRPVMSGNRCCGFHKSGMSSYIHPDQNCQFRWGDADRRTGSSSEIDVGERVAVGVADDEARSVLFIDRPGRREAAGVSHEAR